MKNENGVTLIELLVSIVILGMILIPLLMIMTGTSTRTASQERATTNAYLAQEVMEKVRINDGIYKVDRNDDGSLQTYCASKIIDGCASHESINPLFEAELNLSDTQVLEIEVIPYSENLLFNEVSVIVRNNDRISNGPDSVVETENRIELVTVVKR